MDGYEYTGSEYQRFTLQHWRALKSLPCHELRPSIVVVVDTFLDATVQDGADCIDIPGYSLCCRKDRPSKKPGQSRGGIAVYCLEGVAIFHDCTIDPEKLELIWFSVTLHSQKVLVAAVNRVQTT